VNHNRISNGVLALGTLAIAALACSLLSNANTPPAVSAGGGLAPTPGVESITEAPVTQASSASGSGVPVDPCALITAAEAQSALGEAANPPVKMDLGSGLSTCKYDTATGLKEVGIDLHAFADAAGATAEFDKNKQGIIDVGGKVEPVSGIGDQAFSSLHAVDVVKGTYFIVVVVNVKGTAEDTPVAITMAQQAVARLP
jgi:hypothetical protein